jgi:hypothetical protein
MELYCSIKRSWTKRMMKQIMNTVDKGLMLMGRGVPWVVEILDKARVKLYRANVA